MVKARPVRDRNQLRESVARARKLITKTMPGLRHPGGTAVADTLGACDVHLEAQTRQNSMAAGGSAKLRKEVAEELHKRIADYARKLLSEGKERRQLVGIISGKPFKDIFGKERCYRETTVRKILKNDGIIHPKKKTSLSAAE